MRCFFLLQASTVLLHVFSSNFLGLQAAGLAEEEAEAEGEICGLGEAEPEALTGGPRGEMSFSGISLQLIFLFSLSVTQGPSPNSIGAPRSALEKKTWLFLAKNMPKGKANTSTTSTIRFVRFWRFWKYSLSSCTYL